MPARIKQAKLQTGAHTHHGPTIVRTVQNQKDSPRPPVRASVPQASQKRHLPMSRITGREHPIMSWFNSMRGDRFVSTILERIGSPQASIQASTTAAHASAPRSSSSPSSASARKAVIRPGQRGAALIAGCLLAAVFILHPLSAQMHTRLVSAPVILADGGAAPASNCGGGAGGPC